MGAADDLSAYRQALPSHPGNDLLVLFLQRQDLPLDGICPLLQFRHVLQLLR